MNNLELESAFQASRSQGNRRLLLWNRREFPEIVASEVTFGKAITVIDCWLYDNETVSNVRHDIQETEIEKWLDIAQPRSKSDEEPSAGLRIIHRGQWDSKKAPFSQPVTQAINRTFGLPDSVSNFSSSLTGACVRLRSEGSHIFVCRRGKSAWTTTTVLRYNPKTNVTVGYVYSARPLEIRDYLDRIPLQFAEFPHPLLLPLLMHELALDYLTRNIDDLDLTLQVVEAQTGFSDYEKLSNSRRRDYRPQIDSLGSVTHRFAYDQVRLRSVELTNQFLRQQISSIGTWFANDQRQAELEDITIRLQERLDLSWSSIQHMQLYRGFEKRLQVRQNVIFNLIAQQDSAANIEIAAATQRDSAGMKVIAVLTTLLLPGTFVAAFLAMPMFNWQASDGSQIIGRWFWIYWAVTVPLTIIIGFLIMRWVVMQGRRNRADSRATRDTEAGQSMLGFDDH